MTGDPVAARSEAARLQTLRDAAAAVKIAYWADQLDIQAEVVRGLATCAEGNAAECLAILRAAADREDATEKHVVTPGPILPAREVVATVLLRQGNSQNALREYEAVLAKEPNRYRALAGALQAAERAGITAKAKRLAAQMLDQTAAADSPRPEIDMARRLVSR